MITKVGRNVKRCVKIIGGCAMFRQILVISVGISVWECAKYAELGCLLLLPLSTAFYLIYADNLFPPK